MGNHFDERSSSLSVVIRNVSIKGMSVIRNIPVKQMAPKLAMNMTGTTQIEGAFAGYLIYKPFLLETNDPILEDLYNNKTKYSILIPLTELVAIYA